MAIGLAHMLGYKLPMNFNLPYLAPNLVEFWRRWHITLSSWLRDYLFFPLGGSRGGFWRTGRNLFIVMTLCGLWHGATWPFVIFGMIQAVLLILHRLFKQWCAQHARLDAFLQSTPGTILRVACTLAIFSFTLVFVRSPTMDIVFRMYERMFAFEPGLSVKIAQFSLLCTVLVVLGASLLCLKDRWAKMSQRLPAPLLGMGYAAALTLALVLTPAAGKVFIYFQF
jgi:alginate O-acetyltransferase complex protein AlgI